MPIILNDNEYYTAVSNCSENIKAFLQKLNEKDSRIKWGRLDKDGCRQLDGSYFRIMGSQRSAKEQIKLYEKGRKGVKYSTDVYLFPNEYTTFSNTKKYVLKNAGEVKDKGALATNAWAGESKHNWGLAVDLCLRHFGDKEMLQLSDGLMSIQNYYSMIGLTELANECGLEWGGLWAGFPDVVHFEDSKVSIPAECYHLDKNMSYSFIKNMSVNEKNGTLKKPNIFKAFSMGSALGLGVGAYILYKIMGGKR